MSAIKNYYHEEINRKDEGLDYDYQYQKWCEEIENREIEEAAEKAEFFRVFERTGTYPM